MIKSNKVVVSFTGEPEAVSAFMNDRFVKPAIALGNAERAELIVSDQMNDLRRERDSQLAELLSEKEELEEKLELANTRVEIATLQHQKDQDQVSKWQQCAFAFQSRLESTSKNADSIDEVKGRLFNLLDQMAHRQLAPSIRLIREMTGCSMIQARNVVKPVFDLYQQVAAPSVAIALPPSSKSEQLDIPNIVG